MSHRRVPCNLYQHIPSFDSYYLLSVDLWHLFWSYIFQYLSLETTTGMTIGSPSTIQSFVHNASVWEAGRDRGRYNMRVTHSPDPRRQNLCDHFILLHKAHSDNIISCISQTWILGLGRKKVEYRWWLESPTLYWYTQKMLRESILKKRSSFKKKKR